MTEKELLYVEDAIGHEKSIIKICNDIASKIEDEELKDFLKDEIEKHNENKEKLMNLLEVHSNE